MKLKAFLVGFPMLLLFSCAKEEKSINGTYGMVEYFSPIEGHIGYAEPFLLDIKNSIIIEYGTVKMWGTPAKFKRSGDTLILNTDQQFYREKPNEDVFVFKTRFKDTIRSYRFKKYPGLDTIIDKKGMDGTKLASFLNLNLIAGKYDNNGKTVQFMPDGRVIALKEFSNYTVRPRIGTNTCFDDCIIETTNSEIWKYEFFKNELVLTKYTNKRDSWEHYILSGEQIILNKI